MNIENQIKRIVKKKKIKYLLIIICGLFLMSISLLSLSFYSELSSIISMLSFVLFVTGVVAIYKTLTAITKNKIFSPRYEGVIIKKHISEFNVTNYIGKYSIDTINTKEYVLFIEDSTGKVRSIEILSHDQANYYKEGDSIVHLAGTIYPIITDCVKRRSNICPLCGEIIPCKTKCEKCDIILSKGVDNEY